MLWYKITVEQSGGRDIFTVEHGRFGAAMLEVAGALRAGNRVIIETEEQVDIKQLELL